MEFINKNTEQLSQDSENSSAVTEEQLADNFNTLMDAIIKAKPASAKGTYLKSVTITSTMGPGIKVNTLKIG